MEESNEKPSSLVTSAGHAFRQSNVTQSSIPGVLFIDESLAVLVGRFIVV